jgi:NitT/TauT family transport system ATP-binding protein
MSGQTLVLEAKALSFSYRKAKPVFEDVNLSVAEKEIVCFLGGSGCGKSTMLKILAGLDAPVSGDIEFLGAPLIRPHPSTALVFQQASLLPWLNVHANASFGLDFTDQPVLDRATRITRVQAAIDAVALTGHEHAFPAQLSGGMAQRVAIARALAREPVLLFADEPFSALDEITRAEMQDLLIQVVHRWQMAVLLVTHDIDEAILLGDRILLMGGQPGKILKEWQVDIPRPREAHSTEVLNLRLQILSALRETRISTFSTLN